MSFEVVADYRGEHIKPVRWVNSNGVRAAIVFLTPHEWGGVTGSGIYVPHDGFKDDYGLPPVFGVIQAILHDSPMCVLNLPREQGGLMPGDLVMYPRRATVKVTELRLYPPQEEAWEKLGADVWKNYDLLALAESEILCRMDGILPDPWAKAVAALGAN